MAPTPSADGAPCGLPADAEHALLALARASIAHGLRHGAPLPLAGVELPAALHAPAASFVTLHRRDGELRGCIGELEPRHALAESVARNAWSAASRDPRFPPLAADEFADLAIRVAVLGPLEPLPAGSEAELIAALRPGVDGVLLDDGVRRGTFLPAVWRSLPEPEHFVRELRHKAGLPDGAWPAALRIWRYAAREIAEPG